MLRTIRKASKKAGLAPGTLIHVGEKKADQVKLNLIDYDQENFAERELRSVEDCQSIKAGSAVSWIDVNGLHDPGIIEKIGDCFSIHPLVLEDILNTEQRPKLEEYDGILFIVVKMLNTNPQHEIDAEQVSFILGNNLLISFQEKEGDVFEGVRSRIRKANLRIRKLGADYLCYALLDAVVDNYFIVLEGIGEKIEDLEEELLTDPTPATLQAIHRLRGEAIFLRRSVWPLREVINGLTREDFPQISDEVLVFYRDVYDHTIQVLDTIETYRDIIAGMLDLYLSSLSNRMNEVMKVLTIIATIFIPLSFIVGLYGMNFRYMPELEWKYGYLGVWCVIIGVVAGMVMYFKRKKWF